ncbi:Cysteine protease atg4 [Colletotrichum sp. CLE4]
MKIAKPEGSQFHPTLILVGTRLGIDKITPVYWEALIAALQMPQSVGIAGGRPSSSHYFIGTQGSYLFYLDPHHTRPALPFHTDPSRYSEADIDTAHTRRLRRLHVRELDPSMLIGFLIQDEDDWAEWRRNVKHVQGKAVIHVADYDPVSRSGGGERDSAIDEVETLSDDDGDTILDA